MKPRRIAAGLLAAAALGVGAAPASAQMFHLYLYCKGQIQAGGKSTPAHLDLALRDNNQTALIQRSNVLPVGERMKYVPTNSHYTMVYQTPLRSSVVYAGWYRYAIFSWYPAFDKLALTRLSIDRQSGDLEGEMIAPQDELLGRFRMNCEPKKEEDAPAPRF